MPYALITMAQVWRKHWPYHPGKHVSHLGPQTLQAGMKNKTAALENHLLPMKLETDTHNLWPGNPTSECLLQKNEIPWSCKYGMWIFIVPFFGLESKKTQKPF